VPGRDGGPDAAPKLGLASVGGLGPAKPSSSDSGMPGVDAREPATPIGGGSDDERGLEVGGRSAPAPGGPIGGVGAALPEALRAPPPGGPARGGGGVAAGLPVSAAPPFLFTHLPRSVS